GVSVPTAATRGERGAHPRRCVAFPQGGPIGRGRSRRRRAAQRSPPPPPTSRPPPRRRAALPSGLRPQADVGGPARARLRLRPRLEPQHLVAVIERQAEARDEGGAQKPAGDAGPSPPARSRPEPRMLAA